VGAISFATMTEAVRAQIHDLVTTKPFVLFMKGDRQSPQCGFSAQVVQILDGVVPTYETVNVLSDPALRDGVKEYSSWPTIPQLYVKGAFVGGCDIVKEMYASGELQKLLGVETAPVEPPRVVVTAVAAAEINKASSEAPGEILRLSIGPQFENDLFFDAKKDDDFVVDAGGLTLLVDRASAKRANGVEIDFVSGPAGGGFRIENPNEPPRVRKLSAKDLARMLEAGEKLELFDVRPEAERDLAKIARALPLDTAGIARLEGLPKDTPVVFHCHHGVRSRAAAGEALRIGLTRVYNLEGGIAAWSSDVDPSIPQY
jgi:monothiol glutaredoxin